jgi:hypothetical protein
MLNKDDVCVIVGSYPQDYIDSALASLTVESFKRQGYDICFVSHAPVNQDIQKVCKYFIYSDENYLLKFPEPSSVGVFYANSDIFYQTNWGNRIGAHSYCVLANIKNALWLLQNKKYKKFIYVDSDTFLNQENHQLLESKLVEADFMNKDFWFMIESDNNSLTLPVTSFFAGDIKYVSQILDQIDSPEKYLEIGSSIGGYALEAIFSRLFIQNEHNGHLEYSRARELFNNPWLGISSSVTEAIIPGLKEPFQVNFDIVKHKSPTDLKEVSFVIEGHSKNEPIKVNLYKDNIAVVETELITGAFIWWIFSCGETKVWKMEIFHNNKLFKVIERTTEEIFWNYWSYLELNNVEN